MAAESLVSVSDMVAIMSCGKAVLKVSVPNLLHTRLLSFLLFFQINTIMSGAINTPF